MIKQALNLVIPRYCICCSKRILKSYLCDSCFNYINLKKEVISGLPHIKKVVCLFEFTEIIQKIIHFLKYNEFTQTPNIMERFHHHIVDLFQNINIDLIVPVPLYFVKKRERGYNQSEYICDILSQILNKPRNTKLFKRDVFTKSQTKLNKSQREANVKDVFSYTGKDSIYDKTVLIVDDVYTTGSTLNEVAKVAYKVTEKDVFGFTLARA